MWIALALQAAQSGGVSGVNSAPVDREELQARLTVLPRCPTSDNPDEVVVCGSNHQRNSQRLERLDPRFEELRLPDGRFIRRLSDSATLEGGGPRGSVGITFRTKF
jgi:hypothetical protein